MKAHVILLVSSNPVVIRTVEDAVLGARHGFRHIADRGSALRELKAGCDDIDLAILDVDTEFRSLDLLHAARERVPVLVLTNRAAPDMERILQRHGAGGTLGKPFTEAQVSSAIHGLLKLKAVAA